VDALPGVWVGGERKLAAEIGQSIDVATVEPVMARELARRLGLRLVAGATMASGPAGAAEA
jgi:hypothetical protein